MYSNSFEAAPGTEWSRRETAETPKKKLAFLGDFGPESVQLNLTDLPRHRMLRVVFDLYLLFSWDGSEMWGPDVWGLDMGKDRRLIHSTFSNCGFFPHNNSQTFPEWHPSSHLHKGWTGSQEKQSLGYTRTWGGDDVKFDTDSVYHFDLLIPHSGKELKLNFESFCEDTKEDQSWGLDNVRIEVHSAPIPLPKEGGEALWDALDERDGVAAYKAMWSLIAAEDGGVAFISEHAGPGKAFAARFSQLILALDSDGFAERERATQELIKMGGQHKKLIERTLQESASPEASFRLKRVLEKISPEEAAPSKLRNERLLHVLEVIGTSAARSLSKQLEK